MLLTVEKPQIVLQETSATSKAFIIPNASKITRNIKLQVAWLTMEDVQLCQLAATHPHFVDFSLAQCTNSVSSLNPLLLTIVARFQMASLPLHRDIPPRQFQQNVQRPQQNVQRPQHCAHRKFPRQHLHRDCQHCAQRQHLL